MVYNCTIFKQFLLFLQERLEQQCLLCGLPSHSDSLCHGCRQDLPENRYACHRCAIPLPQDGLLCANCQEKPPAFDSSHVPLLYRQPVTRLVHDFKFRHRLPAGRQLTGLFYHSLQQRCEPLPQRLIPVASHASRIRERGFDTALWIADQISRQTGIRVERNLLIRRDKKPDQHGLSARQRRDNPRNSFALLDKPDYQHIAIVDDVMTTGSTVNEIARLLRAAGVKKIEIWAIARTPPYI
jgi:ComF family protein